MGNATASGVRASEQDSTTAGSENPVQRGDASGEDSCTLVVLQDYPYPDLGKPILRTGEKLQVLSDEDDWWRVYSAAKEKVMYIPKNHTGKVYREWLFEGVARDKAVDLLHLPGHIPGSFMIRESMKEKGVYSLSVWNQSVKHYRILRLPTDRYCISPNVTFKCLEDLVHHYSESANGLCCALTTPCLTFNTNSVHPCDRSLPTMTYREFDWKKIDKWELAHQSVLFSPDNGDSAVSFGVRSSVAFYASLAGLDNAKQTNCRKDKNKSCASASDDNSFLQLF